MSAESGWKPIDSWLKEHTEEPPAVDRPVSEAVKAVREFFDDVLDSLEECF